MNQETLYEIACTQISDMVDQLHALESRGDHVAMAVLNEEIRDLTRALDSDDAADNFFYAPRLRYLS